MGSEKTNGGRFVGGPIPWRASRVLMTDGVIDQGVNELLESGIGRVPIASLVSREVETLKVGVRERRFLPLDEFGQGSGQERADQDPTIAFDLHGPLADPHRTELVENVDDVGGEEQPLALSKLAEPAAVLLDLTDPGLQRAVDGRHFGSELRRCRVEQLLDPREGDTGLGEGLDSDQIDDGLGVIAAVAGCVPGWFPQQPTGVIVPDGSHGDTDMRRQLANCSDDGLIV